MKTRCTRTPTWPKPPWWGVPDDVYGEQIVAFVVAQSGTAPDADDLVEHVKTQLSSFKAPVAVHFLERLPKSGVGKILRRALRDEAAEKYRAACVDSESTAS